MASGPSCIARLTERLRQLQEDVTSFVNNTSELAKTREGLQQKIETVRRLQASVSENAKTERAEELREAKEAHEKSIKEAEAARKETLREFARVTNAKHRSYVDNKKAEYSDLLEKLNAEQEQREKKLRAQHDVKLNGLEYQLREVDAKIQAGEDQAKTALEQINLLEGVSTQSVPIMNASEANSVSTDTNLGQDQANLPTISSSHEPTGTAGDRIPGAIIAQHGRSVAISCKYCGANANSHTKTFFRGLSGANQHVRMCHADEWLESDFSYTSLLHLNVEEVSQNDLAMIRAGIKTFPMVYGDDKKKKTPVRKPGVRQSLTPIGKQSEEPPNSTAWGNNQDYEEVKDAELTPVAQHSATRPHNIAQDAADSIPTGPAALRFPAHRQHPNPRTHRGFIHETDRKRHPDSPDAANKKARSLVSEVRREGDTAFQPRFESRPETAIGDEQVPNNGNNRNSIHPRFPTVVNTEGSGRRYFYCEISCAICGANADTGGEFFDGKGGLLRHVQDTHDSNAESDRPYWRHSRRIGERDVFSMLRGEHPQIEPIVKRDSSGILSLIDTRSLRSPMVQAIGHVGS